MTHPPNAALLRAALDAAAHGGPVFPLIPGGKRPALHGETRCPRTGACADGHVKWEARATRDPERIRAAWSAGPFNVGIATGPAGLVIIDLDMPKSTDEKDTPDGVTTFTALCERNRQDVPRTRTVRTASGGKHLYFTSPGGAHLPSTKGDLGPRIDTRAWGGCVVAPGSIVNGRTYEVEGPGLRNPLPGWLTTALLPAARPLPARPITPARNGTRLAKAVLDKERARIATAQEGARERTLFTAARAMGRFVAWGDIDRTTVEEAFQAGGEAAGLKPYECRSTLRSALDWSVRTARPREAA